MLLVSYFEDIDRYHNDLGSGPWRKKAEGFGAVSGGRVQDERRMRQMVRIDGRRYDLARFCSLIAHGHTREYRRYDTHTGTHLCGTALESWMRVHGRSLRHVNHATRFDLAALSEQVRPRVLFLSTTFLPEPENIAQVAALMRRLWPGVPVILGGQVLVEYSKIVTPEIWRGYLAQWGADAVVVSSRGEVQALAIVESEPDRICDLDLPMTWVRTRDGSYRLGSGIDRPATVDETTVRWDLLDRRYVYHLAGMRTARSCAFSCSFCSHPANNGPLDTVDLARFEQELSWQRQLGVVRAINFTDDTFNVPLRRFQEILKILARHDLTWGCYFRCQYADEDTVKAMADAGCRSVYLGIEALDDEVLANMNKRSTREHYERGIEWLSRAKIATHANFVVGFPGDKPGCGSRIARWVDDCGVDFYCVSPFYCSPATPVWQERERFGLTGRYWAWRHHTMDAREAFEAEIEAIVSARRATYVSELVAHSGWSAWFFLANGLSIAETRAVLSLFGRLAGKDTPLSELSGPEVEEARAILQRAALPSPPDADLLST